MPRRHLLDHPFDRVQDRLNRWFGWGIVICLLVPVPLNLLEDVAPPVPGAVGRVAGALYLGVFGALLAASIALPLVVFFLARRAKRQNPMSRGLRRAAIAQGLALALLAGLFGLSAEPLLWGLPAFVVAALALAVAATGLAGPETDPAPGPGFSATGLAMIIALIALLMLPAFGQSREHMRIVAMKSDLRNLQASQEALFDSSGAYRADVADVELSRGVSIDVVQATSDGWSAYARHEALPEARCAIYVGTSPVAPATAPGTPECDTPGFVPVRARVAAFGGLAVLVAGLLLNIIVRRGTRATRRPPPAARRAS